MRLMREYYIIFNINVSVVTAAAARRRSHFVLLTQLRLLEPARLLGAIQQDQILQSMTP